MEEQERKTASQHCSYPYLHTPLPPSLPPLCGAEILAADKQLAEEIAFDLKRVEGEQKKATKAAQTPLAATPHAQMVRGRHKDDYYVEVLYM